MVLTPISYLSLYEINKKVLDGVEEGWTILI